MSAWVQPSRYRRATSARSLRIWSGERPLRPPLMAELAPRELAAAGALPAPLWAFYRLPRAERNPRIPAGFRERSRPEDLAGPGRGGEGERACAFRVRGW